MKLLARMIAFLSFLVMFQYANAAGNSVYVDQIGSGSTVNMIQTGNSNAIGNATSKARVDGNNNTVTVEQIGNSNIAALTITGDGVTVQSVATGNSNDVSIACGVGGSCTGSSITNLITGDGNTVVQNTEGVMTSIVTISTNNNTVDIQNDSTAVAGSKSTVTISSGGANTVEIKQTGAAGTNGHDADVMIVGASNTVDIKQGGSFDSKVVSTITGSSNSLTVKSNHQ